MVTADLNIICLGQRRSKRIRNVQSGNKICVESYNRNGKSPPCIYAEEFPVTHQLRGIWYRIWPNRDVTYQPFFDLASKGDNHYILISGHSHDLEEIMQYYLELSPIHMICVLVRLQYETAEHIHDACTLTHYFEKLRRGEIRFNESYILKN